MNSYQDQVNLLNQKVDNAIKAGLVELSPAKELSKADKEFMLKVARISMENKFRKINTKPEDFATIPENIKNLDGDVFVTAYNHGQLRACKGSSKKELSFLERLIAASIRCLTEERFGDKISRHELNDITLDITLMVAPEVCKNETIAELKDQIELGIHSIKLESGAKKAYFKSSVPVDYRFSFAKTIQRLERKAGLKEGEALKPTTTVTKYSTLQFAEEKPSLNGNVLFHDKYRGNNLLLQSAVNRYSIENALKQAANYLRYHTTAKGRNTYEFDYKTGERTFSSVPVAVIRRLASTWILAEAGNYLNSPAYRNAAKRSLEYILQQHYQFDEAADFGYLIVKKQTNIGCSGFLINALCAIDDPTFYPEVLEASVKFILSQEDKNLGLVYPMYLPVRNEIFEGKQLYYPGEAFTGLINYYKKHPNSEITLLLERCYPYYHNLFRTSEKRINMAAWMSKPYAGMYSITADKKYADFIFEINDFVASKQFEINTTYIDKVGTLSQSGNICATGVFLESLAEGLQTAKLLKDNARISHYTKTILLGLRYIMQYQLTREDVKGGVQEKLVLGGFKTSPIDRSIRVDNVQHCLCAMLRALETLDLKY